MVGRDLKPSVGLKADKERPHQIVAQSGFPSTDPTYEVVVSKISDQLVHGSAAAHVQDRHLAQLDQPIQREICALISRARRLGEKEQMLVRTL